MGMVLRNIIFDTQILIKRDRGVDPVRIIVIASGKHASEQQASIKEILLISFNFIRVTESIG